MAKVLVLYYSSYGHIETMAHAQRGSARHPQSEFDQHVGGVFAVHAYPARDARLRGVHARRRDHQ